MKGLLEELKRRKVFRVAITYAVVAFVVIQVAELVFPALLLPEWTMRLVVVLVLLGFPIALVLAWAFEMTPEGVRPQTTVASEAEVPVRGAWRQLLVTMAVVVVLAAFGWWLWRSPGQAQSAEIRAIAVLPFENISAQPGDDYFSDGMTEALISHLGRIGALTVISRTSAMRYADSDKTVPEIASELGVDAIIEGSVLRADDDVAISARLVQAVPERQLWGNSYERPLRDVLALQSEVAQTIAEQVQVTLTPREVERLAAASPVDPQAYEAYLRGRFLWNQRTEESLSRAIDYFERAIEIDSTYALAWSGLAETYILLPVYSTVPTTETLPKAEAAARRAIALADDLGEAHSALATVRWNQWQWDEVEPEFLRAIELSPGYATAHQWYGSFLYTQRRHAEAIPQLERARELDPLSGIVTVALADVYFADGRESDAIALLEDAIAIDPAFVPTRARLIAFYEHSGRLEEAIAEYRALPPGSFRELAGLQPDRLADMLEPALEAGGERGYFEVLERIAVGAGIHGEAAEYAALAGNIDGAFDHLDAMVEARGTGIPNIKGDYRWRLLHDDPRFDEVLRRVGLTN